MNEVIFIGLAAVIAFVALYAWPHWISPEIHHIVADLTGMVTKLETFIAKKEAQIADHVEEIALHNHNLNLKQADQARAQRIRDKLNELLN